MEERERKIVAERHLNLMVSNFEKFDCEKKTDIDERANFLIEQINFVQQLNIVNTISINEYLARIEKKRIDELNKLNKKEYKEQVINFNDDVLTDRERMVLSRKNEANSLNEWRNIISKDDKFNFDNKKIKTTLGEERIANGK